MRRPDRHVEVEMKLSATPDGFAALEASPLLGAATLEPPWPRHLESVYYDTSDLRLRARRVALRVRRVDGRFVQTVKSAGAATGGLQRRGEWEAPVDGLAPAPAAMTEPAAAAALEGIAVDDLQPLFATRVERRARRVRFGPPGAAADIEVAFDEGMLEAGERTEPIREIELELIDGPAAPLHDLALALHRLAPVRVEPQSKAARGYALATGDVPAPVKAKRLSLDAEQPAERVITAVLGAGLEQWMANQDPVLDGSDPEGVHQMRVALRRLRSALSLFKDVLPGRTTGWIRDETRWLAGSLGPAREWDVFMAQTLAPVEQAAPGDPGLAAVRAAAEAERQAGYETARAVIGSPRYTTLVLSVGRWLDTSGWREAADAETLARLDAPALDFTRGLLGKRHRKLLKAGKRFDTLTPEERHQARIQAKKLRYPADFFRSLYPKKPTKAFLEALARLQDGLGHLNDVATARTLVGTLLVRPADTVEAAVDRSLGAGLVLGWHTRGAADLEPAIRKDWRAFARTEPFWRP